MVPGQFVADNSSQDNSSRTIRRRTIRRGQFVAKYKINLIESTASISATLFSSIPLPLQQHYFHHSRFHISYIIFTTSASISATLFITPDSTSETFLSLIPLPFLQHYFRHFRF